MQVRCSLCNGRGGINCASCSGTRYVIVMVPGVVYFSTTEWDPQGVPCPVCSARGYVTCPECGGTGYVGSRNQYNDWDPSVGGTID